MPSKGLKFGFERSVWAGGGQLPLGMGWPFLGEVIRQWWSGVLGWVGSSGRLPLDGTRGWCSQQVVESVTLSSATVWSGKLGFGVLLSTEA